MSPAPRFVGGAIDLSDLGHPAPSSLGAETTGGGATVAPYVEVNDRNVEEEVIARSSQVPVILVVTSAREPSGAELLATLRRSAEAQPAPPSFIVAHVDADSDPYLAQAFGIRALPTVLAVALGQGLSQLEGPQTTEDVQRWLAGILAAVDGRLPGLPGNDAEAEAEDATDPRLSDAAALVEAGNYGAAMDLYDQVLAEGPNEDARRGRSLAEAHARQGTNQPAALAEADAALLAGRVEEAFAGLIEQVRLHRDEEAKQRVLDLFAAFGNADPRVKAARTQLASALY